MSSARRRLWIRVSVSGLAVLLVVLIAQLGYWIWRDQQSAETLGQVCARVEQLGGTCSADEREGIPGPRGEQGIPGPGPTDAQVLAAVEIVLSGVDLSTLINGDQLTAAVAAVIGENPPAAGARGPGPTGAQILAALVQYFELHPLQPGPQGPQGEKGEKGDGPSQAELIAAFAAYIAEHPGPYCPPDHPLVALEQLDMATGQLYEVLACARPI